MPKTSANAERGMDGVEKAAILLIALGPEKSAQIFKHLKEEEIEQLTLEIANTSSVSPQTKEQVLNEFYEVCLAQQYIAEGGITYAKELLEKAALEASIYIAVDTLEFLKKGGRVTPAAAAIGSVLGIKPLLSIQGDKLDAYAKVRGMKRCRRRLIEAVEKDLNERFSEGDMSKVRIATAGSFRNPELAEDWRQEVARAFPDYEVVYRDLGCSIESHTGPEAMAAGVFRMF